MKSVSASALIGLCLLLAACSGDPTGIGDGTPGSGTPPSVKQPFETVELAFGDDVHVGLIGRSIELDSVMESRCPTNAYCVWPGVAVVGLQLGGVDSTLAMTFPAAPYGPVLGFPERFFVLDNFEYLLYGVAPYPGPDPIDESDYTASVAVWNRSYADHNVIITDICATYLELEHVGDVDSISINDNDLSFITRFGGGCVPHYFTLFATSLFKESFPVQVDLFLHHAGRDPCEAYLREELSFDLSPIRDAYLRGGGELSDGILLNLHHPGDTAVYQILYEPTTD